MGIKRNDIDYNKPNVIYGTDDNSVTRKIRVDEDGNLYIEPVSDYFHKLAMGEIPNRKSIYKFGRNANVGATEVLIATNGYYGLPTVARRVTITSSDVNDDVSGTGARTIRIYGLDANYDEIEETVTVNQLSTNSYLRVYMVIVLTSGTNSPIDDANIGTLTVTQEISGTIMCQVLPHDGQTKVACYTIPAGYVALMWSADTTTGEGKSSVNQLKSRDNAVASASFTVNGVRDNFQNTVGQLFKISTKYTEKTDIVFTAKSSSAGTAVSASFLLELVKIV